MGDPELDKIVMWTHITKTNICPNCKKDLGDKQVNFYKIAIIIICKNCNNRIFYGFHKFFGAFFL